MDINQILSADTLDILFDGRNKGYGAYALRKTYNKRMTTALLSMIALLLLFLIGSYIARGMKKDETTIPMIIDSVQLDAVEPMDKPDEPPPPPPPPAVEPPRVEIIKSASIRIVADDEVQEKDMPPEVEKLDEARIGLISQEGIKDDGILAPPASDDGKGILSAPRARQVEDDGLPFIKVEKESEYPGGQRAWMRYLNKTFRYPQEAADNTVEGTVVVQFIVDKEGIVSDVVAISGPTEGGLREEAIRVIKRSGKWIPAVQNGNHVKSYKKQPITFRLQSE